jgi:uncharacterized membrane protein
MSDHLQHELKKEFQLERMILFSDAVFAIAITLLAIEIKLPAELKLENNTTIHLDRHTATDNLLLHGLAEMIGKFIGFFISFFIIGLYWIIHHRMFGYVINYNRKLLWLNLIFLMAIVLMPFSTGFYSEYAIHFLKTPVIVYTINIIFLGVMNYILWNYVTNPKHQLAVGITTTEKKYFAFRAIIVPSVFFIMSVLYLVLQKQYAIYIPLTIPLLMRIFKKFYFKKHNLKV